MSTRARITIVDVTTGEKNYLYRGCDGYPAGLGEDLVRECDKHRNAPDADSFVLKLLKGADLEIDRFGEDACLDWVYTLEWNRESISVFAQEVDWLGDNKRPVAQRLGERIDVRKYVEDLREKERQMELYVEELGKSFRPCPFCGSTPRIYVSDSRTTFAVRCPRFLCKNNHDIEAHSAEELIEAWNRTFQNKCLRGTLSY